MSPKSNVCQFYLQKSCRFGDECLNRHEKPSYSKIDDEFPILTFNVAASSKNQQEHQNVQQTLTNESLAHSAKNINEIHPKKSKNKSSKQNLSKLRSENQKLVKKINSLETSVNTLSKQLQWQERKNAKLIDEFNMKRLNDEDYKCLICLQVFIRPILLGCEHMFCELCINQWIVDNQFCPTCDDLIENRAYCLSMDSFIKRMKERMPEDKIKKKFKKSEESQAEDEITSV